MIFSPRNLASSCRAYKSRHSIDYLSLCPEKISYLFVNSLSRRDEFLPLRSFICHARVFLMARESEDSPPNCGGTSMYCASSAAWRRIGEPNCDLQGSLGLESVEAGVGAKEERTTTLSNVDCVEFGLLDKLATMQHPFHSMHYLHTPCSPSVMDSGWF